MTDIDRVYKRVGKSYLQARGVDALLRLERELPPDEPSRSVELGVRRGILEELINGAKGDLDLLSDIESLVAHTPELGIDKPQN